MADWLIESSFMISLIFSCESFFLEKIPIKLKYIHILIDWLIERSIDWLIEWSIDRWSDGSFDWLIDWLGPNIFLLVFHLAVRLRQCPVSMWSRRTASRITLIYTPVILRRTWHSFPRTEWNSPSIGSSYRRVHPSSRPRSATRPRKNPPAVAWWIMWMAKPWTPYWNSCTVARRMERPGRPRRCSPWPTTFSWRTWQRSARNRWLHASKWPVRRVSWSWRINTTPRSSNPACWSIWRPAMRGNLSRLTGSRRSGVTVMTCWTRSFCPAHSNSWSLWMAKGGLQEVRRYSDDLLNEVFLSCSLK